MPEIKIYDVVRSGEVSGSVTAKQLPDVGSIRMVQFVAPYDNTGYVYIGGPGVTKPDGTTDTTTGIPLRAGDATPLMPVPRLDIFYIICDNAGDDVLYIAVA